MSLIQNGQLFKTCLPLYSPVMWIRIILVFWIQVQRKSTTFSKIMEKSYLILGAILKLFCRYLKNVTTLNRFYGEKIFEKKS